MSRANTLDTRTINYLELIANGKGYRVPPYQRDYSWSEEQWEDLWNDVLELRGRPDDRHYMGALVVERTSDREFLIIDGQQRMATLSILALAVIGKLRTMADRGVEPDRNQERAKELRNRFIGEKDPASLVESSRLYLNATDNAFYQDYLVQLRQPLNPRGLPKSNRLLWDCFRYLGDQLDKVFALKYDGEALARVLSETVARQLLFILITVDDELNAYTVFETLNARGLELTTTDLLKNYLFSRVKVSFDLDALQRRWRSLIATVATERFPEFLRYHLLCEHPKIRSQRLFKLVRDRVKTLQDFFALLDALEVRAELFASFEEPNHGYWAELPSAKPSVRDLDLLRVRQMTPVLFAAWERFSREDFVRVLKLVSIISFRYTGRERPQSQRTGAHLSRGGQGRSRWESDRSRDALRALGIHLRGRCQVPERLRLAERGHRRAAQEVGQVHLRSARGRCIRSVLRPRHGSGHHRAYPSREPAGRLVAALSARTMGGGGLSARQSDIARIGREPPSRQRNVYRKAWRV